MVQPLRMSDLELEGRRVLIREDLNVPVEGGKVTGDQRIRACVPTLRLAIERKARVMVLSHLGRPREGEPEERYSLAPVARRLRELLDHPVRFAPDWLEGADAPQPGEVVLCENVRFNVGEGADDEALARKMASLCDVFVMDAFGTAHRAQASTHGVAKYAPVACAGPLLSNELDALGRALSDPARPMLAVVGGAKVSTKLAVLESLSARVDRLIVGGGIANTFIAAAGRSVGRSLYEPDLVETARRLMRAAQRRGAEVPVPSDVVVAEEISPDAEARVRAVDAIRPEERVLDVGPETARRFAAIIAEARTIVWNGPVGVFEHAPFAAGTRTVAEAIARSDAFSIAGGGETLAAVDAFGVAQGISYISTGGGAFLEYLEGRKLPAVAILEQRAGR